MTPRSDRLMPDRIHLGSLMTSTMSHAIMFQKKMEFPNPKGLRMVMGFVLPEWQRPLVWTHEQSEAFMRSVWLGLPIGTYSYNVCYENPELDGLLIDGQQRLHAVEQYLSDAFPVFGHLWSEVTKVDRRHFSNTVAFHCFISETNDEQYLRNYYNIMNFSGVRHTQDQRA